MDDRPKRLLIVDDDEDYRVLVKTFIQVGMGDRAVVDEAASMAGAWARLDKESYDLCLFDYRLGKESGLTLLKEVRAKGIETPVIFLTGQGDERTAVEAMKAGATDYLIKSKLRTGVLNTAIRHAITIHEKEQQRWLAEEALRIKTDQLQAVTGAMTAFLESGQWEDATVRLLRAALTQTQSETGFAGVMLEGPVLRILASEGSALECLAGREEYEKATKRDPEGGHIELTTFDHLLGKLVSSGGVVLANDPAKPEGGRGRGSGVQGLRNFLGVPMLRRGEVAGIFGVANRPGGFTEEDQARLDLLAQAAGVLFDSYRRRRREAELERYLRQADKLASLGTLLGGVAHELNNPLFMISGYAQLAVQKVKEGLYDGLTSDLAAIHDATNRASTIVERSLGAARSTQARRVACQVNGVIQKTLQLVANDCLIHQIE
ncbi:MAG: response regulator, partial [Nitrospirales bacterium]